MDYIDRLTDLRIDRKTDQKTIGELLGVKQSAISKYEKRRAQYKVDDIIKLCIILRCFFRLYFRLAR